MAVGKFIGGIAAVIRYAPDNTYLLLKRAATKDSGAGEWESVTGRVDQGEGFEQALHREVYEELQARVTIEFILGTSHFYRGTAVPENELLGVRYLCSISDPSAIVISDEHSEYRWLTAPQIFALLPTDHWLVKSVRYAEVLLTHLPDEVRSLYREMYAI